MCIRTVNLQLSLAFKFELTMEYKPLAQLVLLLVISSCCFAIISAEECPADKDKDWSYDLDLPNGPQHWGEKYPNCNGNSQSPVNIITRETESSGESQRLELHGYDEPIGNVSIMNTGSTILVTPQDGVERSLTLDGKKYTLLHIHFNWGNATHGGSEDVIDGRRHTMETRFIHQNEGKLVTVSEFLMENNEINSGLYNILSQMDSFQYAGQSFEGEIHLDRDHSHRLGQIYLEDLIDNGCPFYRYEGSMSFPPCNEGVTWLICRNHKGVRRNQLNGLYRLYSVAEGTPDADKCHMLNIYRPVQSLNRRKVYK